MVQTVHGRLNVSLGGWGGQRLIQAKMDPEKVGLRVANFDVAFLDATIKAGAAGHFDPSKKC